MKISLHENDDEVISILDVCWSFYNWRTKLGMSNSQSLAVPIQMGKLGFARNSILIPNEEAWPAGSTDCQGTRLVSELRNKLSFILVKFL